MSKLKVAILADDVRVSHYTYDLCKSLLKDDLFEAPSLITGYLDEPEVRGLMRRASDLRKAEGVLAVFRSVFFNILWRTVNKLETRAVTARYPDYGAERSVADLGIEIVQVKGTWSKNGIYLEFDDDALKTIADQEFDVLIRCGSGILRGEILELPPFGILSFHHGDNRVYRGGPSGFWEVLNREPSSGFVIQKLTEELDGGEVIFRGNIMTSDLWMTNSAALHEKSNPFMIRILKHLAIERELTIREAPSLYHNRLYKLGRDPLVLMKYVLRTYLPILKKKVSQVFRGQLLRRWNVAYSPYSGLRTSLFRYREIANPEGRFLADPFVLTENGSSICFVEDLFFADDKGRISAIELREDGYDFLGVVLEEDFHLSFPYVFRDGEHIYMVPESHQANQIRLYKCEEFPTKWVLEFVLMDGVSAVDTLLIRADDGWYMLTSLCSAGIGDYSSELHIFCADTLKTTDWRPLACGNPVIFDSRKARSGGLFHANGKLVRVNQVQRMNHYGASFELNEIIELNSERYAEKKTDEIYPNFKDGAVSTHHFHTDEHFSVVDFMRYEHRRDLSDRTRE